MTGGYTQYMDPYQQMMLTYGGGTPQAQPQAAMAPGPPGGASRGATAYGGVSPSSPNTPANFSSNIGPWAGGIGTVAGMGLGIPGLGMASGALGQVADAARYGGVLNANGVNFSPNYGQAALYGASALPFGLGSLFGESARQQSEAARRDALAMGITDARNSSLPPGLVGPAQERSFFTDLFGGDSGGSGADTSGPGGSIGVGEGGFGPSAGGMSGADGGVFGWAKGGKIPPPRPGAKNPPGPDDQVAGLQTGEGVINRPAMKAGWGEMLSLINSDQGGALAQLLRGMLK